MDRKLCVTLVSVFMKCVFRIKTVGRENIPENGGAVLALNHRSNWDVIIAGVTCPRGLRFMAKSELFKNKLFGWLISSLGAFPVKRGKGDIGAIKSAVGKLRENDIVLIFPEGMRSSSDTAGAKGGMILISQMAKVPIIPAYISGKYRFMHKVTITYGEPIYIKKEEKMSGEEIKLLADDVMKKIRSYKVE